MVGIARTLSLSTKVTGNCSLSISTDCEISIATETGVQIMDLRQNPADYMDQFSFNLTRIPPHPEPYTPDIGVTHDDALQRDDHCASELGMQLMYDRTLNHHSPTCQGYKLARWSPAGMDDVSRCVLVTLTLDHRLSVYSRGRSKQTWTEVVCLSDVLTDHMKSTHWCSVQSEASDSHLYKERLYSVSVTEFAWNPHPYTEITSHDKSVVNRFCYLATATKSGSVILLKVKTLLSGSNVHIDKVIQLPSHAIVSAMHWCCTGDKPGCLVIGCVNGRIYKITLDNGSVTDLWTEDDNVKVTHIIWLDKTDLILASKGTFIVMLRLSDVSQPPAIKCVSDKLPITGLVPYRDGMICVSSANSTVHIGNLTRAGPDTVPFLDLQEVAVQRQSTKLMANHGLAVSPNHMFIALTESPAELYCHLLLRDPLKLHIINLSTPNEVTKFLFNSKLNSLRGLCDVLLSLKFHISQLQSWPEVEQFLEKLTSDEAIKENSLIVLRLLRFILQLKLKRNTTAKEQIRCLLEKVTEAIKKTCFVSLLNDLVGRQLSTADQTIACLICHVLRQSDDNGQDVVDVIEKVETSIPPGTSLPAQCPICKTSISDINSSTASCQKGHTLSRCPQTLLICHRVPYRICVWCQSVYTHKAQEESSDWLKSVQTDSCLFCDQSLVNCL